MMLGLHLDDVWGHCIGCVQLVLMLDNRIIGYIKYNIWCSSFQFINWMVLIHMAFILLWDGFEMIIG